jgi:hypothetical protein
MTAGDLLRIGQLIIQKGKWNDIQIVPESWINLSFQSSQKFNPECGLLWWIIPEKKLYSINDSLLNMYKNKGVPNDLIQKFNSIKGVYDNYDAFLSKLSQAFGDKWNEEFDNKLYPFTRQIYIKTISDNILGYEANGWLGQYLIIYPKKKIIGVRMIKESTSHQDDTDQMWNFKDDVYKLIN